MNATTIAPSRKSQAAETVPAQALVRAAAPGTTEMVQLDQETRDQAKGVPVKFGDFGDVMLASNMTGSVTALLGAFIIGSGAIAGLVPLVVGGMFYGAGAIAARNQTVKNAAGSLSVQIDRLKRAYREAQIVALAENKQVLCTLADQELAAGRLLDQETLSYLVRLDGAALEDASDQLTISVLQARRVLAYMQCEQRGADGAKAIAPALSFARLKLCPQFNEHRYILRRQLEESDEAIKADDFPESWPEPDLSVLEQRLAQAKGSAFGGWSTALRFAAAPVFMVTDAVKLHKIGKLTVQNSEPPALAVPPLTPVAELATALAVYEQTVEPLGLPALRGWPQQPRRLDGPAKRSPSPRI